MRLSVLFILLVCTPLSTSAQQVSFLIEEAYASGEVPVQNPAGLTGGAARRYREKLQKQYEAEAAASSAESIIGETVVSSPIEVVPSDNFASSESSESSIFIAPKKDIIVPKKEIISVPVKTQQEQDELTLEQLEEYADEAAANVEDQITQLEEGFSITSTSSLGSPLPSTQRSAILRRSVRTIGQLKLFARALAESDDQLRKIEVREESVTVSYRRKAWMFGFIPFNFILETTVDGKSVSVKKPWWLAIARDGVSDHIAAIETDLEKLPEIEVGLQGLLQRIQQTLQAISNVSQ